jgi:hypothetical protein
MNLELFAGVPEGNCFLLDAEAGACFEFAPGDCRIVLAVGRELEEDTEEFGARHGVVLREETLAAMWACWLTHGSCTPTPGSRLYRLPCHWASPDAPEGAQEEGAPGNLLRLLEPLDHLRLLAPEGASAFAAGENADDAVWFVALVGRDGPTGERFGYIFRQDWLERLWQLLLLGPGATVAIPGNPYEALFEAVAGEDEVVDGGQGSG